MNDFQVLREKAERLLDQVSGQSPDSQVNDVKAILHELEVRRIELEVQNDELRESQTALDRSRSEFFELFEFAPIGYAVLDQKGEVEQINQAAASLFGFSRPQLVGMRLSALVLPPGTTFNKPFQLALDTAQSQTTEVEFAKKHSKFWARIVFSAKRGGVPKALCAITDITEQKSVLKELDLYRHHLEGLVKERTLDLEKTNLRLKQEVAKRQASEAEMSESLKEKEVLLREIHHRVKNNMQVIISLLRLQARKIDNHLVKQVFQESRTRIMAMSIIHETLYRQKNLAHINLREYLARLTENLIRAYARSGVHVHFDIDAGGVAMDIDQAVPCGLIVSELVSNALKYAFPEKQVGRIAIQFKPLASQRIQMRISDDGVGLPADIDLSRTQTMGLATVNSLAQRQLQAEIAIVREQGTGFIFRFPRRVGIKHDI